MAMPCMTNSSTCLAQLHFRVIMCTNFHLNDMKTVDKSSIHKLLANIWLPWQHLVKLGAIDQSTDYLLTSIYSRQTFGGGIINRGTNIRLVYFLYLIADRFVPIDSFPGIMIQTCS